MLAVLSRVFLATHLLTIWIFFPEIQHVNPHQKQFYCIHIQIHDFDTHNIALS